MNKEIEVTTQAVKHIDAFLKTWCIDTEKTNATSEPQFRCNRCEFVKGGKCVAKMFANKHEHNYPMEKFGAMSR